MGKVFVNNKMVADLYNEYNKKYFNGELTDNIQCKNWRRLGLTYWEDGRVELKCNPSQYYDDITFVESTVMYLMTWYYLKYNIESRRVSRKSVYNKMKELGFEGNVEKSYYHSYKQMEVKSCGLVLSKEMIRERLEYYNNEYFGGIFNVKDTFIFVNKNCKSKMKYYSYKVGIGEIIYNPQMKYQDISYFDSRLVKCMISSTLFVKNKREPNEDDIIDEWRRLNICECQYSQYRRCGDY